jgi:protein-L-isoaspartate O-methyltransferase
VGKHDPTPDGDEPLNCHDDPDRWLKAAYRNVPILIQFDDGKTRWPDTSGKLCTSSASKPDLALSMLAALDVDDGHTVLEIGTGTGYNAALLAARLGAPNVTTVEIDPVLATAARAALDASGFPVTVLTGDGAQGYPANAPYARVIATAAVRVGELPYSWVAQTRPGGVIVTPMRTDFGGSVPLVRLTVDAHGTATGRPVGRVGFMAVRSQRTPEWTLDHLDPEDPAAKLSTTTLKPWRVAENHDVRWAIGTRVPRCVWEHQPPTDDRKHHLLWLLDPTGESWAVARYDTHAAPASSASMVLAACGTRSRRHSAPGQPPGNHLWTGHRSPSPQIVKPSRKWSRTGLVSAATRCP